MSEARNPYAAPDAAVADVDVSPVNLPRPVQVARACQLMWISIALNVIATPFTQARQADALGVDLPVVAIIAGTVIGLVFGGLITWWVTSMLSAGRNWMRLLVNIFFGISAVGLLIAVIGLAAVPGLFAATFPGLLDIVFSAVLVILGIAVVVLINVRPSREWFLAMRRQPR